MVTRNTIIVPVPPSTPQSLKFPYDQEKKKFSTSSYNAIQTQNRVPVQELEQFLEQANVPMKQIHDKYEWLTPNFCRFLLGMFFLIILFPLAFCFACYLIYIQDKAEKQLDEAVENSKYFIRKNNKHFIERGLMWKTPLEYPQWIELQTSIPEAKSNPPGVHTSIPIANSE